MALKAKDLSNVRPDVPAVETEKKGVIRGKKQVVTIGFVPGLLEDIDAAAEKIGVSRAAFVNIACREHANRSLGKD